MKYSVSRHPLTLTCMAAAMLATTPSHANKSQHTPASDNIKNFMSGTWEGTFQAGIALPQSSTALDNAANWSIGLYHDFGSRMATELQYFSSTDFNSTSPIGGAASFQTSAFIASLRGYGHPGPLDLQYFGRLGVAMYSVDFDNGAQVISDYDSGHSIVLGFGAEKRTNDKTTFSIEFTYFSDLVQSGYVNTINVGVRQALVTW